MSSFSRPVRRATVALCIAVAALLGVGVQWHGLTHALKAMQTSSHEDGLAGQTRSCDQCLLFAAIDGLATAPTTVPLLLSHGAACEAMAPIAVAPAVAFAAYESRAPPAIG